MAKLFRVISGIFSGGLLVAFAHLFCCGLPALFSIIGVGATTAGMSNSFLDHHKTELFIFGGVMLLVALYYQFHPKHATCPIDSNCAKTKRVARGVLIGTTVLYAVSFYLAFFYYPSCAHGALPPLPVM